MTERKRERERDSLKKTEPEPGMHKGKVRVTNMLVSDSRGKRVAGTESKHHEQKESGNGDSRTTYLPGGAVRPLNL